MSDKSQTRMRIAWVVALAALAETVLYFSWSHIDDNDRFPSIEIQLAVVAGVAIFFMPHTLAALARNERPSLYLPAGLIGILLTVASMMSPVLLILTVPLVLVPSGVYLARTRFTPRPTVSEALTAPVLVAIAIASVWSLFLRGDDYRCYYRAKLRDGTEVYREVQGSSSSFGSSGQLSLGPPRKNVVLEESGCSSDVTTYVESGLSLSLHAFLLLLARQMGESRELNSESSTPHPQVVPQ